MNKEKLRELFDEFQFCEVNRKIGKMIYNKKFVKGIKKNGIKKAEEFEKNGNEYEEGRKDFLHGKKYNNKYYPYGFVSKITKNENLQNQEIKKIKKYFEIISICLNNYFCLCEKNKGKIFVENGINVLFQKYYFEILSYIIYYLQLESNVGKKYDFCLVLKEDVEKFKINTKIIIIEKINEMYNFIDEKCNNKKVKIHKKNKILKKFLTKLLNDINGIYKDLSEFDDELINQIKMMEFLDEIKLLIKKEQKQNEK